MCPWARASGDENAMPNSPLNKTMKAPTLCLTGFFLLFQALSCVFGADDFHPVPLRAEVKATQPMTGLVYWSTSEHRKSPAISMEFAYLRYDEVSTANGLRDWSSVERLMSEAAARGHQLVLRLHDTYPGRPSGVPARIKAAPGYHDISVKSEGKPTGFPDWTNAEWRRFVIEFMSDFAQKYDTDPRLAFLEVGFGLWAEYHVYDPGEKVGVNFPDKSFQAEFMRHMAKEFKVTRWLISKDAHVAERTPFKATPDLFVLPFGIFDDTFHRAWKPGYNRAGSDFFGRDRWQRAPVGGEQLIDSADFAHMIGEQWQTQTSAFHISFIIADQWPRWMNEEELARHSAACGYRFKVERFEASDSAACVTIANIGVAPIYYDAYPAVNGVRAAESLAGLLPGKRREFTIASGGTAPALNIESDRLVPSQRIEFEANLNPRVTIKAK